MNKKLNLNEISWKEVLKDITLNKEKSNISTGMPTEEDMKNAMKNYIDMVNKNYHEGTANLFADNYTLKDPFGTKALIIGDIFSEDIFKDDDVQFVVTKAELISPISTSYGNQAAMAFKLYMTVGEQDITIDVIDVMKFDEFGKIVEVMAHWGKENVKLIDRK